MAIKSCLYLKSIVYHFGSGTRKRFKVQKKVTITIQGTALSCSLKIMICGTYLWAELSNVSVELTHVLDVSCLSFKENI